MHLTEPWARFHSAPLSAVCADTYIYSLCQKWISKFYTQVVHYPKKSITNLWLVKGSPLSHPFLGLLSPKHRDPSENVKVAQPILIIPVCCFMALKRNWGYFESALNRDLSAFSQLTKRKSDQHFCICKLVSESQIAFALGT